MPRAPSPRWTEDEDRLLWYAFTSPSPSSTQELARTLRRSPDAIRRRATHLGLRAPKRRKWSPNEDSYLRERLAMGVPASYIAAGLERPVGSIRTRMRTLSL